MINRLALHGGEPIRATPFPEYRTIGEEEKRAALAVIESGVLSQFLGTWSDDFYGGPQVRGLEQAWAERFGVARAISMNSATSGLYAAVGAAGVGPGDEVIVSPYTMTASATCALVYGAVPVFADIAPDTFCLDPESVRSRITPRTKAIVVVDLFGRPADLDPLLALAREHDLIVIEDAAQAPGAIYRGRYAGTVAHMGVFSLNYHKTIHSGEGGIVVTDDDELAERLCLIRNHGEVVVKAKGTRNLINLLGFNYRMTEIEAAIAHEQLKKLDALTEPRRELAAYLNEQLAQFPELTPPATPDDIQHVYYVYPLRYDADRTGVPRERIVAALQAEGIPVGQGYVEPLYLEPVYQQRIGMCAFNCPRYAGTVRYGKGLCPVTERMHYQELITHTLCRAGLTTRDMDDIVAAFEKVLSHAKELAIK